MPPLHEQDLTLRWIKLGGIFGVAAVIVYTMMVAVDMPEAFAATLAASFGPLFSLASFGAYRLLALERNSPSLQIAVVANAIAGGLITAMLLVQIAVRSGGHGAIDPFLWTKLRRVDLGLDVAWDIYGVIGTLLFAANMLRHPRFGRIFGGVGLVLGGGLGILNLATFPTPPGDAGLVDLGPLTALWYAAMSIQLLRSRAWAEGRMTMPQARMHAAMAD